MSSFASRLVGICLQEWEAFGRGSKKETSDPQYKRIGEYWRAVGVDMDGRTEVRDRNGSTFRPAWSAAFVSWAMQSAGAGSAFRATQAHCHYIDRAMAAADSEDEGAAYWAIDPEAAELQPGDIICAGSEYALDLTFRTARVAYQADTFYPSHGDIVVQVLRDTVETIGGNVANSVSLSRSGLSPRGSLLPRIGLDRKEHPWIAVLKCRL